MPEESRTPPDAAALAESFRTIGRSFDVAASPEAALAEVAAQTVRMVPGSAWVSVTVGGPEGPRTAAATARAAAQLDREQYATAEGPCLTALRDARPCRSDDLVGDRRWPALGARISTLPVRSVLSVPVLDWARPDAAYCSINVYGATLRAFGETELQVTTLLAGHVTAVAGLAAAVGRARAEAHHLNLALDARDVIGQAKGILMAREGLTAAQAFELLRSASQRTNRKLRDIADELTFTGRLGADAEPLQADRGCEGSSGNPSS